jgi:hypothetical protein
MFIISEFSFSFSQLKKQCLFTYGQNIETKSIFKEDNQIEQSE